MTNASSDPTPAPLPLAGDLSDAELTQLRDALRLSPADRLRLAASLWAFARATPHYRPKTPDQFREP